MVRPICKFSANETALGNKLDAMKFVDRHAEDISIILLDVSLLSNTHRRIVDADATQLSSCVASALAVCVVYVLMV